MSTVTVIYPNTPDAQHDVDYYLKTHMPLVQRLWKQYGLLKWSVSKFASEADKPAPYTIMATLEFENRAAIDAALASPEAKDVLGDIKNFSNVTPVLMIADTLASETT